MSNTDKNYPCPNCGTSGNIIRETPDPRLKCNNNNCKFMYNASDSLAAVEANAIPDKPPVLDDPLPEPSSPDSDTPVVSEGAPSKPNSFAIKNVPRTLKYLIVAKDRFGYDFANEKEFRKKIMQWEAAGRAYSVYELTPKQVTAKVDISK